MREDPVAGRANLGDMRRLLVLLSLAVLAVGCSRPAPPPDTVTVRVGNVPSLLFAPLYVAMDRGDLKAAGIEVQLEKIQAGQDAVAFLANGQLDFVVAGYSAGLFNAVDRGMDVKVIAPMGIQPRDRDASPLVAKRSIRDVAALRGKRIAVPGGAGSAGSFLVALRLKSAGLTLKDVELVNIGLADQPAALASGSVEAAQMAEPYASQAVRKGDGLPLTPGALAGVNASGLLTSGKMLKDRSDVVNRFTAALLKAARDLSANAIPQAQLLQIYSRYTGLPEELLASTVAYDFSPTFDLTVTKRDLAALQEIMVGAGILHTSVPVDRLVDAAPAAAAAR